jgi:hypothetical protein
MGPPLSVVECGSAHIGGAKSIQSERLTPSRLIGMAMKGIIDVEYVAPRKPELEADVSRLEGDLAMEPPAKAVDLHPAAIEGSMPMSPPWRSPDGREYRFRSRGGGTMRTFVAAVVVHRPPHKPVAIEIRGEISRFAWRRRRLPPSKKIG